MGNVYDKMLTEKVQDEIITIKYELHSVKKMFFTRNSESEIVSFIVSMI